MAIADTITSMQTHTTNAYNVLAYGTDLTGVNKNLENLKQCIFDSIVNSMSNTTNPTWNNLPKITTTPGTSQSINNTIEAPMRIELGASELTQDGTPTPSSPEDIHTISGSNKVVVCGNNIFDIEGWFTNIGASYTKNNDESYTLSNQQKLYSQPYIFSNTNINVSLSGIVDNGTSSNIRVQLLNSNDEMVGEITSSSNSTLNKSACKIRLNWSTSGEFTLKNIILNKGTTALPYTPYVSQEADIDLKSKNFFDEALLGQQTGYNTYKGGIWTTNGASAWFLSILYNVASSTTRDVTKLIPLGVGTYTIKINDFVNNTGHASPINWRLFDVSGEQLSTENTANTTITITTTQKCYLDICRTNSTGTLSFSTIMINKGSTALPYVPYYDYGFYGKIGNYEDKFIRNSGKNKLPTNNINISQAQMTVNSQVGGGLLFNGTKYGASAFNFNSFDLEPGDYTFAIRRNGGSCSGTNIFNFINTATNQVQFTKSMYMTYMTTPGWNNDRILNFTLTEKTNLLFSMTIPDYNVFTNFDMEMVIYKGTLNADTLGEYEPYGSNELYIKNTIFEKIFDGNENWGNAVQVESSNYYRYENQDFRENNCLIHSTYLSDKFKYNGTTGLTEQNVITNTTAANTNRLWITIDTTLMNGTTVADFKTWLSTHNVKVKYVANTPTYTKITGTLAEQLENVYQKMLSYSGQTNISQVNNDLSFVINASALKMGLIPSNTGTNEIELDGQKKLVKLIM